MNQRMVRTGLLIALLLLPAAVYLNWPQRESARQELPPAEEASEPFTVPEVITDYLSGAGTVASYVSQLEQIVATIEKLPVPEGAGDPEGVRLECQASWKQRLAAERLLELAGREQLDQVLPLLAHENVQVRMAAARVIGQAQNPRLLTQLSAALRSQRSEFVRVALSEAIIASAAAQDRPALGKLAADLSQTQAVELLVGAELVQQPPALFHRSAQHWQSPQVGERVADFDALDCTGNLFSLEEALTTGPVAVIFLTGVSCYVCEGHLGLVKDEYAVAAEAAGVQLILVFVGPWRVVRGYAASVGLLGPNVPVTVLADSDSEVQARFGIARQYILHERWSNPPAAFLIDRRGVLRWRHISTTLTERELPPLH